MAGSSTSEADGERAALARMILGYYETQLLYVAAKLRVPDALADGPRSAVEIALQVGADATALGRFLRGLSRLGIVTAAADGRFQLTGRGALLRATAAGSMREAALLNGEVNYPAFGALLSAVETGGSPFSGVFGAPFFEHLGRDDDASASFDSYLRRVTTRLGAAALEVYDFASIDTLMDVGGGRGVLLATILSACARPRGILFDVAAVTSRARRYLDAQGMNDRCSVLDGDFFEALPRGGDLYMLSQILHDWDDDSCVKILSNCREAMGVGARLLVIEQLLPPTPAPDGGIASESDLYMLVLTGGQERTADAYRALFAAAGLELFRVVNTATEWTLLEGRKA